MTPNAETVGKNRQQTPCDSNPNHGEARYTVRWGQGLNTPLCSDCIQNGVRIWFSEGNGEGIVIDEVRP